MRRDWAALLISASLLAPAAALALDARQLMPSPLGIVLTVGQWLMKDRVEVYQVRVQGTAASEDQARDNAFRLAINQAVGSLVLSQTTVNNGALTQHEILNYSSGFIHDFRVLNTSRAGQGVVVEMDVWVSKSLIADRVLNVSRAQAQVEGGRIAAQITSFHTERQTADRVLQSVLADYPARAYDIAVAKTQVRADEQRRTWLVVPVTVSWNHSYVASLSEALRIINHKPQCSGWLAACHSLYVVKAPGVTAHFDDDHVFNMFHQHVYRSNPQLLMKILDVTGAVKHQDCFVVPELNWDYSPWKFVEIGPMIQIQDWRSKRHSLWVELKGQAVRDLDRIEVSVVRSDRCPRTR